METAVFNDCKIWDIPTAELALALRTQELQIFVFDDDDQDDLQKYLGWAKVRLAPIFLAPPQPLNATLDLEDPRGVKNGSISVTVEWHTPASIAAEAQRKAAASLAAQKALGPATANSAVVAPAAGTLRVHAWWCGCVCVPAHVGFKQIRQCVSASQM